MDEKKSLLIPEEEYESKRRLALQSCVPFSGWGSGSTTAVTFQSHAQAVKDQKQCRSCWAFASAAQYELNYYLYKGIKQSQSEQHILDCVSDSIGTCDGGYPTETNKWLGTYGSCPTSSYFGYDGKDTWSCSQCWTTKTPVSKTACLTSASTGYSGTSSGFWNIIANTAQYVGLSFWMNISNNFFLFKFNKIHIYIHVIPIILLVHMPWPFMVNGIMIGYWSKIHGQVYGVITDIFGYIQVQKPLAIYVLMFLLIIGE